MLGLTFSRLAVLPWQDGGGERVAQGEGLVDDTEVGGGGREVLGKMAAQSQGSVLLTVH